MSHKQTDNEPVIEPPEWAKALPSVVTGDTVYECDFDYGVEEYQVLLKVGQYPIICDKKVRIGKEHDEDGTHDVLRLPEGRWANAAIYKSAEEGLIKLAEEVLDECTPRMMFARKMIDAARTGKDLTQFLYGYERQDRYEAEHEIQ